MGKDLCARTLTTSLVDEGSQRIFDDRVELATILMGDLAQLFEYVSRDPGGELPTRSAVMAPSLTQPPIELLPTRLFRRF
jgi:hypothetical protein